MDQIQINQEPDRSTRDLMYAARSLATLATLFHRRSVEAGWWDDLNDVLAEPERYGHEMIEKWYLATKLALIHSEASEALEGLRKGKWDDHIPGRPAEEVELADLLIRIFDYAGYRRLDLVGAVIDKAKYNKTRADHTAEARAAEGGKSF